MARAPFQILVLPFRATGPELFEYALFKRSDEPYWQGIAGGGEDTETPLAAAKREAFEEAQIPFSTALFALQTMTMVMVPVIHVTARQHWPRELYVIPCYCYAADCATVTFSLSAEHTKYQWMHYEDGVAALRWDSERTALWELNERLRNRDLPLPDR